MALVPRFRHDLFVSYAHADDASIAGAERGFVSQLVSDLTKEVGRKVGNSLEVWWDLHKLPGNFPVTPEIVQGATEAAGIVLVVSLAYLRSEWCQRERSTFLTALRARAGSGAVFIVALEGVARDSLPTELQDLVGYQFWKLLPDGRTTRPLRVDFPSDREAYYDRLSQLVQDVTDYLNRMLQDAPVTAQGAALPAPVSTRARIDAPVAVVVAEVTDDLVQQREEVKAYLEQLGFDVLPRRRYSRDDLGLHCRQLRDDLAASKLFVQLLGPLAGDKSDYPKGMAWLRYATACEAFPPERILQWRDPQLEVAKATDADAGELLALPTVRSCSLQEIKQEIARLLQRKTRERTDRVPGAPKCVFVNADQLDRGFATEVSGWLTKQGYIVLESPVAADPAEWREEWETNISLCQSLMLIYGRAKPRWVTQQFLQSSKVLAQRESPIEVLSICVGPPPADSPDHNKLEDLSLRYGAIQYFRCEAGLNPTELQRFVGMMNNGGAS